MLRVYSRACDFPSREPTTQAPVGDVRLQSSRGRVQPALPLQFFVESWALLCCFTDRPLVSRSHLINGSEWRAQRFWPVTRRDAGRIPSAGFNRGATTSQAKRPRAPLPFFSSV